MKGSSEMFHNVQTAVPTYMELDPFQKAAYSGKVKDSSVFTHELRLIKSPAELKLMRESASIACQVLPNLLYCYSFHEPISPTVSYIIAQSCIYELSWGITVGV